MEEVKLRQSINSLLEHWEKQGIKSVGRSVDEMALIETKLSISLPQDIKDYFRVVNGMEPLYPNYSDREGFLFYPLEKLTTYEKEFGVKSAKALVGKQCVIFLDYLQKSWWYGILTEINESPNNYAIIIIPNTERYKIVATSFAEFIDLYISDSPMLYDHK